MSITHVFSHIVTYKKHKNRKIFSPHTNHDIHYYFSKLCLQHTKWKKKLFHVITHIKNLLWHTKIRTDLLKCLYNTQLQVRSVRSVTPQTTSNFGTGSWSGMCTRSEDGIGSWTVFFWFF